MASSGELNPSAGFDDRCAGLGDRRYGIPLGGVDTVVIKVIAEDDGRNGIQFQIARDVENARRLTRSDGPVERNRVRPVP